MPIIRDANFSVKEVHTINRHFKSSTVGRSAHKKDSIMKVFKGMGIVDLMSFEDKIGVTGIECVHTYLDQALRKILLDEKLFTDY